eukprot:1173935-Rhodomonas_salina.4
MMLQQRAQKDDDDDDAVIMMIVMEEKRDCVAHWKPRGPSDLVPQSLERLCYSWRTVRAGSRISR